MAAVAVDQAIAVYLVLIGEIEAAGFAAKFGVGEGIEPHYRLGIGPVVADEPIDQATHMTWSGHATPLRHYLRAENRPA